MSAADEARGVEVRLVGEAIEDAAMRLKGRDLGTVHRDQIAREALGALEPIRAAERQEAAREAVAALRKVVDDYFDLDADPWDEIATPEPEDVWRFHRDAKAAFDRADGVAGRRET